MISCNYGVWPNFFGPCYAKECASDITTALILTSTPGHAPIRCWVKTYMYCQKYLSSIQRFKHVLEYFLISVPTEYNYIMLLQELVSFRHPHVQNPRLQDDYENKCQMYLESPYDEMVAAHIG